MKTVNPSKSLFDTATLRALNPELDARDFDILCKRADAFTRRAVLQVGDFIEMLDGTLRRFTHDWGDKIQTTCRSGDESFYLGDLGADFSGALDQAIPKEKIAETHEGRIGRFWFFRGDHRRAHNGITVTFPCRVWRQRG